MNPWETKSSEIVFETPFIKIHNDQVRNHNGKEFAYGYMELQKPVVSIVVIDNKGAMLLQQNYRHTLQKSAWEIPAGYIEEGEEPLAAAKRELLEETGLGGEEWTKLGLIHQMVGTVKSDYTFFLLKNPSEMSGERDADEQISTQTFFDIPTIKKMIRSGEIDNAVIPLALGMVSAQEKELV